MEKYCKDCKEKLVIGDNWTESRKKAWVYVCKTCARNRGKKHYEENRGEYHEYNKQFRKSKKDGLYHVYVIELDNYAGQTENVWVRQVDHNQAGRGKMRVIYSTPNKQDALELESLLHDIGYKGRHEGGWTHYWKYNNQHPRWCR